MLKNIAKISKKKQKFIPIFSANSLKIVFLAKFNGIMYINKLLYKKTQRIEVTDTASCAK